MTRMIVLVSAKIPHLVLTVLFALVIAGVVTMLDKRSRREKMCHGSWVFVCSIASVVAGSWVMYLVHG